MAPPEAAAPSCTQTNVSMTSHSPPNNLVTKSVATQEYNITLCTFFPTPSKPTKFNPISMMTQLLHTMFQDELSLVLCTPDNDQQIILTTTQILTSKIEFQKFFTVLTTRIITKNQLNICVGCHLLSNQSLSSIKFKSTNNHLLAWLKQAQVFTKSDSLGTACPATISYLTKIATNITHLPNLQDHLVNQLMLIELDAATTLSLAPHLKQAQLKAMSNGDDYVPILPDFELYCT